MEFEDIIKYTFQDKRKRAVVHMFFAANLLQGKVSEVLAPLDLTFQQLNVLSIVNGQKKGEANVNVIKERMFDRMSNVSRLLNKLVEKGWLTKERCCNDQRVVYIHITPEGNEKRKEGREKIDEIMDKFFVLNDEESDQMHEYLKKFVGIYF